MYRCIFILSADLLFIALFPHFIYISIINFVIIKYFPLNPLKGRNVFNVRAHRNSLTCFIWHALAYTAAENSLLSFFSLAFDFCFKRAYSESKGRMIHDSLGEAYCLFTLLDSFSTECCLSLSISSSN